MKLSSDFDEIGVKFFDIAAREVAMSSTVR